jgi:hypothetical protein
MANGIINFDWTVTKLASRIVWESTPNIANNTSSVTANLQIRRTDSYYTSGTWTIYFYGAKYDKTYFETNPFTPEYSAASARANVSSSWVTVATISNNALPHNDSGIADIAFYAKIFAPSGTNQEGEYAEVDTRQDGGIRLDTIYRKANILSAPNFTDEDNPTITYSNPAGSSVSALQACISWTGADDIRYRDIPPTGSSYTFNFTNEERQKLWAAVQNGSNSIVVYFYIATNIGGNIFRTSTPATLTIINAQPVITVSAVDTGFSASITGNNNTIIKGFNYITAGMQYNLYKGATVKEVSISNGGNTIYSSSANIENTEDNKIVFRLVDSRGNELTETITMPMINYIPLTANIDAEIGLSDSDSSKAEIKFKIYGNYFNGSLGARDNYLLVAYILEKENGENEYYTLDVPVDNIKDNTYFVEGIIYDLDYKSTYKVIPQVSDEIYRDIGSASKELKAIPIFDWGESDFNFNVPVSINNEPIADFIIEQGESDGWFYRKWSSGTAECWRIYYGTGINAAATNYNGFYYSGTISVSYPFEFANLPTVTVDGGSTSNMNFVRTFGKYKDAASFVVVGLANVPSTDITVDIKAIGKWR